MGCAAAAAAAVASVQEDIPDEILQACFARLPFRCVARVRVVCKRWQRLSDADCLYHLRQSLGLTQPCAFMVASKYEQGHYAGLQITSGEIYQENHQASSSLQASSTNEHALANDTPCVVNKRPVALLPGSPRLQFSAAAHGRLLYILGGRSPLLSRCPDTWLVFRHLDVCDVVSSKWIQAQPMQEARYSFALAAFTGSEDGHPQLLVAGGYDAHGHALASAELYDAHSDSWHTLPSMNSLSGACKGHFTRGKFYVKMANNGPLALEAFDPTLRCWTSPFSSLGLGSRSYFHSASCNADDDDPARVSSHKLLAFDATPASILFEL